ncbi:MAG: DUF4337 domain-containing protein [Methylobacteriaceae bacterium]|nr:DUF4337 domain-containing protein [Methylobacteriaceae bacterium]
MAGHGHVDASNKKIALLIAVLALFLALAETLAKGAQTTSLSANIEAANLWSFFQAKTIRQTVLRTASEQLDDERKRVADAAAREAAQARIEAWGKTIQRWESEPDTQEGRKELIARAKAAESKRDLAGARYHQYEIASAAFQIGIVLASAEVITGVIALGWLGGAFGLIGAIFMALGLFAPHAVHLFG